VLPAPQELKQKLLWQVAQSDIPLQTLIIQALNQLTQPSSVSTSQWSDVVLSYQGIPDFPAVESYREKLLPAQEIELF
jgi:hypothetical protein